MNTFLGLVILLAAGMAVAAPADFRLSDHRALHKKKNENEKKEKKDALEKKKKRVSTSNETP